MCIRDRSGISDSLQSSDPACSAETSSMGCSCICLSEDDNDFPCWISVLQKTDAGWNRNYGSGARMDLFRLCDSLGTALRLLYLYGTVYSFYVFSSVLSEWRTALEKCRARDHGNDAADLQLLFPVHDCFFCCILCLYLQHHAAIFPETYCWKSGRTWRYGNSWCTDRRLSLIHILVFQ